MHVIFCAKTAYRICRSKKPIAKLLLANQIALNHCIPAKFDFLFVIEYYCDGQDEYSLHPFDCHNYINCTSTFLYVHTCADKCPFISNGTLTCTSCETDCP